MLLFSFFLLVCSNCQLRWNSSNIFKCNFSLLLPRFGLILHGVHCCWKLLNKIKWKECNTHKSLLYPQSRIMQILSVFGIHFYPHTMHWNAVLSSIKWAWRKRANGDGDGDGASEREWLRVSMWEGQHRTQHLCATRCASCLKISFQSNKLGKGKINQYTNTPTHKSMNKQTKSRIQS